MARPVTSLILAIFLLQPASLAATTCSEHYSAGIAPAVINSKLDRNAQSLCFRAFSVLHSGATRTPLWSAEHLTRASVAAAQKLDTRDNRFHAEARLPRRGRAELSDYVRSGYDRGHMAPSGDMGDGRDDHESFSLANIVPQAAPLNRTSWANLEGYVRDLALRFDDVYVVTGPLYEGSNVKALKGRVLVPTSVWKAVLVPNQGAGAWIATNEAAPKWRVVSVAELARRTGVDPFPGLSAATKSKVPAFPIPGLRARRSRR